MKAVRSPSARRELPTVIFAVVLLTLAVVSAACHDTGDDLLAPNANELAGTESAPVLGPVKPTATVGPTATTVPTAEVPPTSTPTPVPTATPPPTPEAASGSSDPLTGPDVDQLAPDLTLPDLDGNAVTLSDYRGQVVLLNFWATW
jgi:hypothetical protein